MASTDFPGEPVHILVNPVAGHGRAPEFIEKHVIPLLEHLNIPSTLHQTTAVRDAGRIGREILVSCPEDTKLTLIIAGGDGTAHEMIEGILEAVRDGHKVGRWELVILPFGTANALFCSLFPPPEKPITDIPADISSFFESTSTPSETIYKLSSLLTSLSPSTHPRRLPITLTSLLPPTSSSSTPPNPIPSHVVFSTSLHAALLATSESLRPTHPGLERFKIAAEANLGVFFRASVKLVPPRRGQVKQYDPRSQSWVEPYTTSSSGTDLDGPFTYLLSSTTTPRLEPAFVISSLLERIPPSELDPPSMDIVILRPQRDPRVTAASTVAEKEEAWKDRAREVLGAAYNDGAHVNLTYGKEGRGTQVQGEGEVVVETFRCGGFEWTPTDEAHEPSYIVCADGSLHTVPKGGMARVGIMDVGSGEADEGFYVWG